MGLLVPLYLILYNFPDKIALLNSIFIETSVSDSSLPNASLSSFHDPICFLLNLDHPASKLDKHLVSPVVMALANSSML